MTKVINKLPAEEIRKIKSLTQKLHKLRTVELTVKFDIDHYIIWEDDINEWGLEDINPSREVKLPREFEEKLESIYLAIHNWCRKNAPRLNISTGELKQYVTKEFEV